MSSCTVTREQIINLPVYLVYYLFPFISLLATFAGIGLVNYDPVWLMMYGVVFLYAGSARFDKKHFLLVSLLIIMLACKYALPVFYHSPVYLRPLIMDGKWSLYLFLAVFWINIVGRPRPETLYKAGRFLCILYIVCALTELILTRRLGRFALLSESNYDCFLFLIPFCFIENVPHRRSDYLLFFLGSLLSGSQTGTVSFLAMCFIITSRIRPKLTLILGTLAVLTVILLLRMRNNTDLTATDRYLFFLQAFSFFEENDTSTLLFGTFPGSPMNLTPLPVFGFYIDRFEGLNNISGTYAFYFHSTYLRLAITWGIPAVVLLFFTFVSKFLKTKYLPMKLYICLVLLQSISLSCMTLTTASFILFLTGFIVFGNAKDEDRQPRLPVL